MTVVATEKMEKFLSNLVVSALPSQKEAVEKFRDMDFPTTRNEYWKYTRLGKITNKQFTNRFDSKNDLEFKDYLVSDQYIVIENGVVRQDLSHYKSDFKIEYKSDPQPTKKYDLDDNQVFTALNNAFYSQVISIDIAEKAIIEAPLQMIFVAHGTEVIANCRIEIKVGKFSQSSIIYTQISENDVSCFNNSVTTIEVDENAHLTLHKLQAANDSSLSVSTEQVVQKANSTFKINTFSFSGLLIRNNINILVQGENCETYMNGAVITKDKEHIDNQTFVDHQVPNCYSNENYKYVLDGQSTGVFNGRVVVRKDAQVINAYQNNGNILLSEQASINSKPELEIYADDVKCSHGSTTGQLDENALFYLQARGISKAKAQKLLVSAFISEIISSVENDRLTELMHVILKKDHHWDF
jgi:Fe-S cluster assembly protein SufD